MRLSVETGTLRRKFDDETAIRMISEAGFEAFDYSFFWTWGTSDDMLGDDYLEKAHKLRKLADELGIECNQAHAPMEYSYGEAFDESAKTYLRLTRAIEFASILGAENIIIHTVTKYERLPDNVNLKEFNAKYFKSFVPYCEKFKICVAVENLFVEGEKIVPVLCDPKEHEEFVRSLGSEWLVACVDIGHAALTATVTGYEPEDVIANMSPDVLKALHVHDNERREDTHTLPYIGNINWDNVAASLKKIGYKGDLTFEIIGFLTKLDEKTLPYALKFAEQTGRLLIEKIKS